MFLTFTRITTVRNFTGFWDSQEIELMDKSDDSLSAPDAILSSGIDINHLFFMILLHTIGSVNCKALPY